MCYSVAFGVTLRLLVINISSAFPAINTAPLTTSDISVTTYGTVTVLVHRRPCWQRVAFPALTAGIARLRIAISAYPTCIWRPWSRRNIVIPFGKEKLEWRNYPMVKISEDMFICFDMVLGFRFRLWRLCFLLRALKILFNSVICESQVANLRVEL